MTPRTSGGTSIPPNVRRVGLVSVHTSPLEQPGAGDGGGLNVYVLQVARRLAARGVEVDVFTRRTAPGQPRAIEVSEGVRVLRVDGGPARPLPKEDLPNHLCSFALAMMRDHEPDHDVLHAHYWLSGWVARRVSERWDVPFLQTFHTLGVLKNSTLAPGDRPEPPLRLAAERRIAQAADKVLGLTCGEARLLHRTFGLSGADIAVVPAGVDLDVFRPDGPRARVDVPPGQGPLLLFVGRLQPLKGPDVAIRTLAEVRRRVPAARLLIVGGVSGNGAGRTDPDDLRDLADELGVGDAVTVLPARPQAELAALYRAADVVLAPSRSETFGLVALEAQACGTPVVAADVSGLRYVVGAGGLRVEGHDPEDHAAAVVRVLEEPGLAADLATGAVRSARASSWERTVDRLLGVYGAVTEARTRQPATDDAWTATRTAS